jgi:DNA-binding beta-propeller fold protein YncE
LARSRFRSVRVKNDNGTVERIDPATNTVIAEIQTNQPNSSLCQGLGVGGDAVWTCDETDLVRIDPTTNAVTARIAVGKYADQGQLPVAFERVWVLTGDGSELVGIDPASNEPDAPIALGTRCIEVVAGVDALWAACLNDGRVLRIDPAGWSVTGHVPMPKASRLGVAEDVWVAYEDGVARIDSSTLNVVSINTDIVPGMGGSILATAEDIWVRQGGAFLSRMDPSTGVITEQIVAPDLPSGGSVLVSNDSVWTTAFDHRALVRLRPHDD